MNKLHLLIIIVFLSNFAFAQAPHIYEHTYPAVTEENPQIRALMDKVSIDSLTTTIEHLSSYHTRRYDSQMIYEVQDWLFDTYQSIGLDSVYRHDFKLQNLSITETGDNIIGIQWGTKYPNEFVVCGAHYDSYNWDGYDPDTIFAPGADDNATGCAGILETAKILSRCSFDRSILYCAWCAEECGLLGSAAFAKDCAEQRMDIVGYFNMDMNGYLEEGSDIHVHLMYTTQDSTFADYFYGFCHAYYPEMPIRQAWLEGGDSDYSSFNRNGYPALHPFEDVHASSPFIHSRLDVMGLSVNNMEQSKRFAELNLGAVATLAGINNAAVEETVVQEITVFPNPASDRINIKAEGLQNVTVYDMMGQKIVFCPASSDDFAMDVNGFKSGLYLFAVQLKNGQTATQSVIIR
ncbi:MAG: M20/M25/M40 family metallo-hydrolase [Bacteroidales bacterium]|nr:M20/M25/M40 family metallo-hydrolase [Bacteroidales bacterium]